MNCAFRVKATLVSVALLCVAACGANPTAPETAVTAPPYEAGTQNMSAMPHVTSAPQPTSGRTPEAIISVAENFAVGFSEFSPFAFDPAEEWFDRWRTYAAPALVGHMQLSVDRLWSWTWNDRVKAFDGRIEGESEVVVDGSRAVVRTTVNRLLLGINETGDQSREQNVTYNVYCDVSDQMTTITWIEQTRPGTPLPSPTSAPGR